MVYYSGWNKRYIALSETNISQTAFDFLRDVGFDKMMEYIDKGAEEVLSQQLTTLFRRRPDLYDDVLHICRDQLTLAFSGEEIGKEKVIDYLINGSFWYFDDVLGGSLYRNETYIPKFLDALIIAILTDGNTTYARSLKYNCESYFKEIKEYVEYIA